MAGYFSDWELHISFQNRINALGTIKSVLRK